jgi:serine/threonine protein kinase
MAEAELRNSLKPRHELHWYRIESVLGQGGFGITYLAYDSNLDQHVAIKEYLPMELAVREHDYSVHPASAAHGERYKWGLDRFIIEARTLAKFKHAAIVRVLSVFEDNNTAYMVMEYESGSSLQQILDRQKTLGEVELRALLVPLLDGLELIHARGFIHRDIKPANIFIREDGSPVLLDFGSARQALGEQTRTLTSIVSPGYAPFEQYYSKSDKQGPWTDIYSLGATLYRSISGVMPMDAIDRSEAILKAERDIFVSATEIGQGRYSPSFLKAVDSALQFSEKKRPQTVAEWRKAFDFDSVELAPPAQPLSAAVPSKTNFAAAAADQARVETRLAGASEPSVAEADASSEASIRASQQPTKAGTRPLSGPAPARRGFRWLGVAAAVVALIAVGVGVGVKGSDGRPLLAGLVGNIRDVGQSLFGGDHDRAEKLVAKGDRALAAGHFYDPIDGSALAYYRDAVAVEETDEGALQGLSIVAGRVKGGFDEAVAAVDVERAGSLLAILESLPPVGVDIGEMRDSYYQARLAVAARQAENTKIQGFLLAAAEDIKAGRLLGPGIDNALARYRAVQVLDPDNDGARQGVAVVADKLVTGVKVAIQTGEFGLAAEKLALVEPLHPDEAVYEQLKGELDAALARQQAAAASELEIKQLLNDAQADLAALRLTSPVGGNALERYRTVLERDPGNPVANRGITKVAEKYADLAGQAAVKGELDRARDSLAKARRIDASAPNIAAVESRIRESEREMAQQQKEHRLRQEQERIAEEARQRAEQDRLRAQAEEDKRRRQEAEAKRLFEEEQRKAQEGKRQADFARQQEKLTTLVVDTDGFTNELLRYGLDEREIIADVEAKLRSAGYRIIAQGDSFGKPARLLVIRFRANLNTASGIFSYAASLALYDEVPVNPVRSRSEKLQPIWDRGQTGVAIQTDLMRVRGEYDRLASLFVNQVSRTRAN